METFTSGGTLTSHVHFVYDVYDRRISKQVDPTGGGTYTSAQWYASMGSSIVLVFNTTGGISDRLLTASPLSPGGRGVGREGAAANMPLADETASTGAVSWLLPDNLGTIRDVAQYNSGTNTTTIVDHLKFDSFGNVTAQSNPANQPLFAFTGMLLVPETGLYYDHARWYDPHTGRFMSQDPTGFAAGDSNSSGTAHYSILIPPG